MSLPLEERARVATMHDIVRLTEQEQDYPAANAGLLSPLPLLPSRPLREGEQYRFHFNMTKCIGCRSCEIACNEQNGNPASIQWRRVGEIEGGTYPDTHRHYLSMGCNHCLDAECLKGCPVAAYTKDPVTGIVLHSAQACIGCQYCVWNCPYSVPQFNAERGVVGKCDMCHGRLTDGLEPACVNACPEAAIEIEIVNKTAWRIDYAAAESPGMPAAGHTISTTRITLPTAASARLERVDTGHIRPEHAHLSLVYMTTMIQAATGALLAALVAHRTSPLLCLLLFVVAAIGLNISVLHLGRPAYAWRALKMWRRSWLSREVLCFGLFFVALSLFTTANCWAGLNSQAKHVLSLPALALPAATLQPIGWLAAVLGIAGTLASAFIYLVPARPSWNMVHTPLDFLLSAALLGTALLPCLDWLARHVAALRMPATQPAPALPVWPTVVAAALVLTNQFVRLMRLRWSAQFEHRATVSLLGTHALRPALLASLMSATAAGVFALCGAFGFAVVMAFASVLLSRYLFFVSVVPLNMALTFTGGGKH
ncbi:MAG: dimethyl sulfoxide reductase anchor subunit [Acidobacteriota bacterium]|nr:dimethyl sulfoxide reductase anchor subunit [Acidobacteriota bacterium]